MKAEKQDNKIYQYVVTLDKKRRLEILFWCQTQSFEWFQRYSDVVVFDTTYKVNVYDIPCEIFVGVDNYRKTILFACALRCNETTSTFMWLVKVRFTLDL